MKESLRYEPRRSINTWWSLSLPSPLGKCFLTTFPSLWQDKHCFLNAFHASELGVPWGTSPADQLTKGFPSQDFREECLSVRPQLRVHHPYRAARVLHVPLYSGECQQNSLLFHPGLSQQTEFWKKKWAWLVYLCSVSTYWWNLNRDIYQ